MNKIKIQYELHSNLVINDINYDFEPALKLLKAIQDENNLQTAANHCGYSYRKSWNLLRNEDLIISYS